MNTKENDPDTLQLLDESDKEWVRLWRKIAVKKTTEKGLVSYCLQQEPMEPSYLKIK